MWGPLLMLSTPLIAFGLVEVIDRIWPIGQDLDPNADYDWDREPFGGELR